MKSKDELNNLQLLDFCDVRPTVLRRVRHDLNDRSLRKHRRDGNGIGPQLRNKSIASKNRSPISK